MHSLFSLFIFLNPLLLYDSEFKFIYWIFEEEGFIKNILILSYFYRFGLLKVTDFYYTFSAIYFKPNLEYFYILLY
jgi:hypothetical protein